MPATRRATTKQTTPEALPIEEQIRQRAYELYVRRGNQSGSEFDDWLQAEAEVIEHTTQSHQTEFRSNLRRPSN